MYFIISPAKEMKEVKRPSPLRIPQYIEDSKQLIQQLQQMDVESIQKQMKVNEKIAQLNHQRFQQFRFDAQGSAAVFTYQGLVFKQLHLDEYDASMIEYMEKHIRILSGLYGVLKPLDSIYPYRLEMGYRPLHLYEYWKHLSNDFQTTVINVASSEYSDVLKCPMIHIVFKLHQNGKYKMQSTQVKIARGMFIDYVIKHKIETIEELKLFCQNGYEYKPKLSDETHIVFVKEKES